MKNIILILLVLGLTSFTLINPSISYKLLFNVNRTELTGTKKINLDSLILISLNDTKKDLSFDLNAKTQDLYKIKKAHCVGYTMYFNKMLIEKLKLKNAGNLIVYHSRVKVFISNQNIHVINSPSFKDHDISIIKDKNTGTTYFIDPSLSEIFGNIIKKY
jgi:hypothetical protein